MSGHLPLKLRWAPRGDILILFCAALLLRGPMAGLSEINWDESAFALVGREILENRWPFTAVFDHKPIGVYLHFAAALAVFGDDPVAVRALGLLVSAAASLVVYKIAIHRLLLSREWGLTAGISYLLATMGFEGAAVYSEHLVNFHLLLAAYLLASPRPAMHLLGGVFAGVACSTNYLAVPVCLGLIAGFGLGAWAVQLDPPARPLRAVMLFAAGGLVSTAAMLAPILLFSELSAYLGPQLAFLAGYAASVPWHDRLAMFLELCAAFVPLAAVALATAWLGKRDSDAVSGNAARAFHARVFAGMAVGAAVAALASGYVFGHYLLLLAPAALLWFAAVAGGVRDDRHSLLLLAVLGGTSLMISSPGIYMTAVGAYDLVLKATAGDSRLDTPRQLARAVRGHVPEGRTIFAVCSPLAVYQLLHVRPPTRYPFYMHMLTPQYASALGLDVEQELESIFRSRPAIVILGDFDKCYGIPLSSWTRVRLALERHGYEPRERYGSYRFFAPGPWAPNSPGA